MVCRSDGWHALKMKSAIPKGIERALILNSVRYPVGWLVECVCFIFYYTFAPRTLRYNMVRCRAFEYIAKG